MKATNSIDKLENVINNIINYGLNNTLIAKEFSDEFKSLEKNGLVNVDKIIKRILETRIGDFKDKFVNEFEVKEDTNAADAVDESKDSEDSNESKCDTCKDREICFSLMGDENNDTELPSSVKKVLEAFFGKNQSSDKDDAKDAKDTVKDDAKYFMLPMEEFENFKKLLKAIKTLKLNLDIKDLYKVENGVFYFNTPKGKNSFDTKRLNNTRSKTLNRVYRYEIDDDAQEIKIEMRTFVEFLEKFKIDLSYGDYIEKIYSLGEDSYIPFDYFFGLINEDESNDINKHFKEVIVGNKKYIEIVG